MPEETDIDRQRSWSFTIARLYAQIQLLVSVGALVIQVMVAVASTHEPKPIFDLRILVASGAAFAAALSFLLRA